MPKRLVFYIFLLFVGMGLVSIITYVRLSPSNYTNSFDFSTIDKDYLYSYKILHIYPHDLNAYTEGLAFDNGILYEGTGLYGNSSIRKINLETGKLLQMIDLPPYYFGEGITIYGDTVIQITWRSHTGLIYDKESLALVKEFTFTTEGWGITHDGEKLIMSDGTSTLYFLDPITFKEMGSIQVTYSGKQILGLNELEYIEGEIYANIWLSDYIARIDSMTGNVIGWVNLEDLLDPNEYQRNSDTLNGIAFNKDTSSLLVTGKCWPHIFEITIIP